MADRAFLERLSRELTDKVCWSKLDGSDIGLG